MTASDKLANTDPGVLARARHDALVENTAQTIFYEIEGLENNRLVGEQRWVWELLQNALDAKPNDRQTQVRITWDGTELTFEHNGDAFAPDELAHLVYHGSTKYRDTTKRGKFGRGFLVTHLLSKTVRVSGLVRHPGEVFQFQVDLDRRGDADTIRLEMDRAWEQIENSRRPVSSEQQHSGPYSTKYVYLPDDAGRRAVGSGIEAARRCFPFVLAFIPELEKVSVTEPGMGLYWLKEEIRNDPSDPSICFTRVRLQKIPVLPNTPQPPEEWVTIVTKLIETQDPQHPILVASMLNERQSLEVVENHTVPCFFAEGLPVVGTEVVPLTVVLNSSQFEVQADRTGLHLENGQTAQQIKNWELLSLVPEGCIALFMYASRQNWDGLHLLANIGDCPTIEWLDPGHFKKSILQPIAQQIVSNPEVRLVRTTQGEHVSIKEAAVPLNDPEGKLFGLLSTWKPAKQGLVDETLSGFWAEVLNNLALVLSEDIEDLPAAWSIESLASKIAEGGDLDKLTETVELEQGESAPQWLNSFIALVIAADQVDLLRSNTILPDQNGTLEKLRDLFHDPGVDEELKDIAEDAGIDIRATLLNKEVAGLEGELKDRTEIDVLNTLLAKSSELEPEQNTELLAWLAQRPQYHERISSFPVLTLGNAQQMDKNRPLLKPEARWAEGSDAFLDLFPKDFILAHVYSQKLGDECWKALEEGGFVYDSLIYTRLEEDGGEFITDVAVEEEEGAEHSVSISVTDIVFLSEKDKGVIDTVRHSQPRARMFLRFIFSYLLRTDRTWKELVSVNCACGKSHEAFACGWIRTFTDRQWVPLPGKRYGLPTAENIAGLLDASLLPTLAQDDDSVTFLQRLGIGISDLFRAKLTDATERLRADRIAARMYAQDAQTRTLLSYVLDNADFRDLAQKHLQQLEITTRNRQVGAAVEQLLKTALEAEHISVERTGIGSDYEVEHDFIEGGQEQGLVVGKYLLEVKATSTDDVRMTLTQGNYAANTPPEYAGYILCVCQLAFDIINEDVVRSQARFMFDIGSAVTQALDSGNALEAMEGTVKGAGALGVHLEIGQSPKRLRVSREAWMGGLDFEGAVSRLKNQASTQPIENSSAASTPS